MGVGTGAKTILKYGWMGAQVNKAFGQAQEITGFSRENNVEELYTLGLRNWNYQAAKQYAARLTVDWTLSNPWFFKALIGSGETAGSSPPYTHTFEIPTGEEIQGIKINVFHEDQGVTTLSDCKIASCRISATQGETARVSAEILARTDEILQMGTQPVYDQFDPYTFAHGKLTYYSGVEDVVIGYVRSVELTYSNEIEQIYSLGSRLPTKLIEKNLSISGRMEVILNSDSDLLKRFFGNADATSPQNSLIKLSNVKLTFERSANENIVIEIYGVVLNTYDLPASPTGIVVEDIGFVGDLMKVVAKNGVSAIP